jgi:starch synthase
MPSRFEPCGLNQLYSLRYGTVPVARSVGGLADTIEDFDGWRRGTGFLFKDYDHRAMLTSVRRALELFRDKRAWHAMMKRGMSIDHSWARSAERYRELYRRLLEG